MLAGLIAERATGQSYSQLLREQILNPLQLDSTFLAVYESRPFAVAHPWQAGVNNHAIPRTSVNSAAWAAGAMYSTSGEMAQWYHALMSGQVINASSLREMTTFVGSGNYGIGISRNTVIGRTVWTHGGTIWGGYNSSMMYDPANGIVICVLINQLPAQAFQVSVQLLSTLINNPVTGLTQVQAYSPEIFPNPTTDFVKIDLPKHSIKRIEIFSSLGKPVLRTTENTCLMAKQPKGVYLLRIETDTGIYIKKLTKQ